MLLPRLGALLLAVNAAQAFKNTSPFLLLSSEPLPNDAPLRSAQIALTKDVEDRLIDSLSDCDRKVYYIYSQDEVTAEDFTADTMNKLSRRIESAEDGTVVTIPEVMAMGELSAESVSRRLEEACGRKGKKRVDSSPRGAHEYQLNTIGLSEPPVDPRARSEVLKRQDDVLDESASFVLDKKMSSVLIYITTPPPSLESQPLEDICVYEMDDSYSLGLHTDLKRDLRNIKKRQSDDEDEDIDFQGNLGLFETYQFFTPGLFMGLTVSLFLIGILYVGISAIAGLEVSYMAFNKEMGPQAQKGKQG